MINSAGLKTHPVITSSLERCKLLSPLQTTENPAHQRALQDWQIVKSWIVKMASKSSLAIQLSNKIKHRAPQCCMEPRPMDQRHAKNFFKSFTILWNTACVQNLTSCTLLFRSCNKNTQIPSHQHPRLFASLLQPPFPRASTLATSLRLKVSWLLTPQYSTLWKPWTPEKGKPPPFQSLSFLHPTIWSI